MHALIITANPREVEDFCRFTCQAAGCTCVIAPDAAAAAARLAREPADLLLIHYTTPADLGVLDEVDQQDILLPMALVLSEVVETVPVQTLAPRLQGYLTLPAEPAQLTALLQRCAMAAAPRYEQLLLQQRLQEARQEVARQSGTLATIYGLGRAFATMLDRDRLLDHVLETVIHLLPADEATVLLADGNDEEQRPSLRFVCSRGLRAGEQRLRVEDSLAEMVMQTGQPLMIAQVGQRTCGAYDSSVPDSDGEHQNRRYLHALLDVPLKVWERPIGVLSAVNKITERAFVEEDRFLLTVVADYAAVAIENARLCNDSQHTAALEMFRHTVATLSHYINNPLMALMAGAHTTMQHVRNLGATEPTTGGRTAPVLRNLELMADKIQEIAIVLSVLREVVVPSSTAYWREEKMIDIEKHPQQTHTVASISDPARPSSDQITDRGRNICIEPFELS